MYMCDVVVRVSSNRVVVVVVVVVAVALSCVAYVVFTAAAQLFFIVGCGV